LDPKLRNYGEITQNNVHYGHKVTIFGTIEKYATSYVNNRVTYILSRYRGLLVKFSVRTQGESASL